MKYLWDAKTNKSTIQTQNSENMSTKFEKEINGSKYRVNTVRKSTKAETLSIHIYDDNKNAWASIPFKISGAPYISEKYGDTMNDINMYDGDVTFSLNLAMSILYKVGNDGLDNMTVINGDREKEQCNDLEELFEAYIEHRHLYKAKKKGGEAAYEVSSPYTQKERKDATGSVMKNEDGEVVMSESMKVRIPTTFVEKGENLLNAKIRPQACIRHLDGRRKKLTGRSRSDFWDIIKNQPLYLISAGSYIAKIVPGSALISIQAESNALNFVEYDNNKLAKEQQAAIDDELDALGLCVKGVEITPVESTTEQIGTEESVVTEPDENDLIGDAQDINDAASFD